MPRSIITRLSPRLVRLCSSPSSSSSSSIPSHGFPGQTQASQRGRRSLSSSSICRSTAAARSRTPESIAQHCRKVICIGRNYAEHITELSSARPAQPFWFLKPTSSLVLPSSSPSSSSAAAAPKVIVPRGVEAAHEIELGLIIGPSPTAAASSSSSGPGQRAKYHNLNLANLDAALPLIGGYIAGIDVTARNVQSEAKRKGLPWSISKGFDTFLPISHFIAKDRIPNPHQATVWLTVNGQTRQRDSTQLFLFDIPRMLNDISKVMTLEEGDIVLTGTPKGVGPLVHGDRVQGGIEVDGKDLPEARIEVVVEDAPESDAAFVYRET